ncbi:hypothetical protein AG1IA_10275 [Rhizoctonia solani AG-1 IA]|uniref:Uncharacterized protein n=1 Tax=Thanatephorus cucumeris (strain AG1-IA) TaxID=983506 RepID=L8WCL9_THACA|nr:hypothetical protein AG1IA_10275 [Rhizoctonia solani AG-1 IA]
MSERSRLVKLCEQAGLDSPLDEWKSSRVVMENCATQPSVIGLPHWDADPEHSSGTSVWLTDNNLLYSPKSFLHNNVGERAKSVGFSSSWWYSNFRRLGPIHCIRSALHALAAQYNLQLFHSQTTRMEHHPDFNGHFCG